MNARKRRLKIYYGNYDGRREALVAATNQREAASALGVSLYEFRNYYHEGDASDAGADLALADPGTVFLNDMRNRIPEFAPRGSEK